MSSLKQRTLAVAKAAITDDEVLRDPAAAFHLALGAARGFLAARAIEAQRAETVKQGSVHESAVATATCPKDVA